MLVVVALGGNALLRRGESMTADVQRANVAQPRRLRPSPAITKSSSPTATDHKSDCSAAERSVHDHRAIPA